ncbi:MAG: radical SAM protein, partial [Phycisphaerae bacterium]|nr:radical SAM protein [Phycisphaerae bacterium]
MTEANTGQSAYDRLMNKAFAEARPMNAQIEITYRCNHLCTFCYNSPSGAREMTTEQIYDVLRKIADLGVLYCTLTGGEALCHKDFYKIAKEVRRLGMALRIYSNGYLMADKKVVRRIKELNPIEVEISIHGARPETHEALTKIKGSFNKTVKALENLNEAGIRVSLKCPITRLNQNELFEIKALAERLGRTVIFDAVITPKDDGNLDPLSLRPDDGFIEKYWGEWYSRLHDGLDPPKGNHCASDGTANCGTGRSGLTIDPYGNLLPCVAFRRHVANVLEVDDLKTLWYQSPVLNEVRDLAVEATHRLAKQADGPFFTGFCLGVA